MHPSVSYSKEDAMNDVLACSAYEPMERPMLLVIDFGTAAESNEGIEFAKGRFDIAWLDHHPLVDGFSGASLEHYVNPWNFGGDSNYTAGFLACVFARELADTDLEDVQQASLSGDYSMYARPTGRSRRIAAILDLITSDTRVLQWLKGGLGADDIDRVLSNEKESGELVSYAEGRMSDMLDLALNYVKVYKSAGALIYVVDFEALRGDSREKYPLPGRFASRLLGRIEELNKKDCVLLLHFGYFVSVRLSKALAGKAGLLELLNSVRQDYQEYVDSAGGHGTAASLKLKGDEMKKEMIRRVVERLKERLG
jgi:RecJ-like exonuclease